MENIDNCEFTFTYAVAWQQIPEDDLFFVYIIDNNCIYYYRSVGRFILQRIESHKTLKEIVQDIVEEFEIDETTAYQDTMEFINEIIDLGIVKLQ